MKNYKLKILYGGTIMQTENTTKVSMGYVITKDGIRMSYEEYRDMIMSERN